MDINKRLPRLKEAVDDYIQGYLDEVESSMRQPGLKDLANSISYSLREGGHRIRPTLAILTAEALGHGSDEILPLGAAIEFIHTYSLIHDDLPCMDDDDLRRGKPSNHKVFGEALAVLAGDALCTEAFLLLANKYSAKPNLAVDLISDLALSSGARGMVGGQAVDITYKGKEADSKEIEFLHSYKTGALFKTSVLGAARICGANAYELKCLSDYARAFGFIFQITDDIADENSLENTQKKSNSKKPGDEPSFVKSVGLEKAKLTCQQLVLQAQQSVDSFGSKADGLKALVSYLYERNHH